MKSVWEQFQKAIATADKTAVLGLKVDPLETDTGEIARCLEHVLTIDYEERPRVVVLLFRGASLDRPLFESKAVRAWAKRFAETPGAFDTIRGLCDDRLLATVTQRTPIPPLISATVFGCGRAKLLALVGYNEGLIYDDPDKHMWSIDDAGEAILEAWLHADEYDRTGEEERNDLC
jgi:hypothetical protein